jgi:outer membrane immunogenic protein
MWATPAPMQVSAALTGEQGFNGSLRARLGYDINPFLLYATGGLAATRAEVTSAGRL